METKSEEQELFLISEEEKFAFKIRDGVEIYYRRVPDTLLEQWEALLTKDTRTQEAKEQGMANKALTYGIIGWKGISIEAGKPAELPTEDEATKLNMIKRLPKWILIELVLIITSTRKGYKDVPLAG